jgi:hypothetical protein
MNVLCYTAVFCTGKVETNSRGISGEYEYMDRRTIKIILVFFFAAALGFVISYLLTSLFF